jgi:hypothetical protein
MPFGFSSYLLERYGADAQKLYEQHVTTRGQDGDADRDKEH